MSIRRLDLFFILVVAAATTAVAVYAYGGGDGRYVSIESGGSEWIYPLDKDALIPVSGPLGDTIVDITDGVARIVASPCRDKICIAMGALDHTGDWSACLPNGVLVRIVGTRGNEIDAMAY